MQHKYPFTIPDKKEAGTKSVTFIDFEMYKSSPPNYKFATRFPQYKGWRNSATWCFNLYFMGEKELIADLECLRRKDRTINYNRAQKLFNDAQYGRMHRVDSWCQGAVDYKEIVDAYLADHP